MTVKFLFGSISLGLIFTAAPAMAQFSTNSGQDTGGNSGGIGISSTSSIDRIEAEEDFYYLTATQEVRGQKGVYTQASNNFVVTGDVILLQDDNIVTGDSLTYNLDTEEARVVSNCKGRKCGRNNRVRVLTD